MPFKSPFGHRKAQSLSVLEGSSTGLSSPPQYAVNSTEPSSSSRPALQSLPTGSYILTSALAGVPPSLPDFVTEFPSLYEKNAGKLGLATIRPSTETFPADRVHLAPRSTVGLGMQIWCFERVFTCTGDPTRLRDRILRSLKPGEDVYTITNLSWNKILFANVEGKKQGKGRMVMLSTADAAPLTTAYMWKVEKLAGGVPGYRITNLESGYCLMPESPKAKGWCGELITSSPSPKRSLAEEVAWRFWHPSPSPNAPPTGYVRIRNASLLKVLKQDAPMGVPYLTDDDPSSSILGTQWAIIDRHTLDRGQYDATRADQDYRRGGFLIRNRQTGVYLAHSKQQWGVYEDHEIAMVETTVTAGGRGYRDAGTNKMNIWEVRVSDEGGFIITAPDTGEVLAAAEGSADSGTGSLPLICEKLQDQEEEEMPVDVPETARWIFES